MAITINNQPATQTGAFGKNIIQATSNDLEVKSLKYELYIAGDLQGSQYTPLFNYPVTGRQAVINLSGLYSSVLSSYNNPIQGVSSNFEEIDADEHQKLIFDNLKEVGSTGQEGLARTIYKAVNTKFNVNDYWNTSGSERFLAYSRKNNEIKRVAFDGEYIPISYYNANTETGLQIQKTTTKGTTNLGLTNANNIYRVCVWKVNSSEDHNVIGINNSTVNLQLSIDRTKYERTKTLYFLNEYGGWEWYDFIDYEVTNKSDITQLTKYYGIEGDLKIQQLSNDSIKQLKLYGRPATSDYVDHLRYLITSPVVLDENGDEVRVLDSSITYEAEGIIDPEITIQYLQEKTIKY